MQKIQKWQHGEKVQEEGVENVTEQVVAEGGVKTEVITNNPLTESYNVTYRKSKNKKSNKL